MTLDELAERIIHWAAERNLIDGSTVARQYVKLVEEFGEFAAGMARNKLDVQADALGDQMVILLIMAEQSGTDILSYMNRFMGISGSTHDEVASVIGNYLASGVAIGAEASFLSASESMGVLAEALKDGKYSSSLYMATCWGNCIAMCFELGLDPAKVLEDVWNIIKDRKGRMVDGVFIKENDSMMQGSGNAQ